MPEGSADLLVLTQWLSPAFPVSGYAYSHGMEAAIAVGALDAAEAVEGWVRDTLTLGAGRADAILLAAAHRGEDPDALAQTARALAASAERWQETEALGRAFAATLSRMEGGTHPARPYPVAVGVAARRLSLATETVCALYLHAFAATLVGAAVRFVPLGQSEGQRILSALHPDIIEIAGTAAAAPVAAIATSVPGGDLAAMQHETLETRIFRT